MAMAGSGELRLFFVTRRTSGVGRRMESILATLQARRRSLDVQRVDADADPELAGRLGVDQIPTLVFVDGGRSVARISGRATLDEIERVLAAIPGP